MLVETCLSRDLTITVETMRYIKVCLTDPGPLYELCQTLKFHALTSYSIKNCHILQKICCLGRCPTVGDSEIVPSKCVRNLGGVLGEELTMVKQVKAVVKSMNFHIRRLSNGLQYLDKETETIILQISQDFFWW